MQIRMFFLKAVAVASFALWVGSVPTSARTPAEEDANAMYEALKAFTLSGGAMRAANVTLKRDRAEMNFTGVFFLEAPVAGRVRGAVFIGRGQFRAEVPNLQTEQEYVRRLLKAEVIESDFKTAVLRFNDDTFETLQPQLSPSNESATEAQRLANEFHLRMLRETGANLASRLMVSILNQETPGLFVAEFDGGVRERFTFLFDPQGRIPVTHFNINGGEKGLIYQYEKGWGTQVWMAFYSMEDFQRGIVEYSDMHDAAYVRNYEMEVDLRQPNKRLAVQVRMEVEAKAPKLRVLPLAMNESLPDLDNLRRKHALLVRAAQTNDGQALTFWQEEWEGGFTVLLPKSYQAGETFSISVQYEGDFLFEADRLRGCYYPISTNEWYPRHGFLQSSTYKLRFLHRKSDIVAAQGVLEGTQAVEGNANERVSNWRIDVPVKMFTFGVGRFEPHAEDVQLQNGKKFKVEFYSVPGHTLAIKEDFILAELYNSLNFFTVLFGEYRYPAFRAVFHPRGFGQGFATALLIPNTDRASQYTFQFIAHETAHQWWGNLVGWRSYRDQWISEGFADYSGLLYTALRDRRKAAAARELLEEMRSSLRDPPITLTGVGKGRLSDVGPIIMGHRLSTRETLGAYQALIYNKGALVLRMLHFLFTNPANGDGQAFFDMMRDFVTRHQGQLATSDTFRAVANEHFVKTPIAKKYNLQNLDWFFVQWVYQDHLPSYRLAYAVEDRPDGSVVLDCTIYQDNVTENWFMPLPLVIYFSKDQVGRGTVHAYGRETRLQIPLPRRPEKVELDPELWVLSEKTETRQIRK